MRVWWRLEISYSNNISVILALLVHIIIYVTIKTPLKNPKNLSSFNTTSLDAADQTF